MKKIRSVLGIILSFAIVFSAMDIKSLAKDYDYRINRTIVVDGTTLGDIKTLDYNYRNDTYVSLRGLAAALKGTSKAFAVDITANDINITTGVNADGEIPFFTEEENNTAVSPKYGRKEIYVDGSERFYYTIAAQGTDGAADCYMAVVDAAMMLNLDIEINDGIISVNTGNNFYVSGEDLEESGYLMGVNGLVIGDGTTGEVYYAYNESQDFAIASTTKLMTYLVYMDAVSKGEVGLKDCVVISREAQMLSETEDGSTPMKEGQSVSVTELMEGLLLPSSNECAYTLACHVAGSEEAFVDRMNTMAEDLGLNSAIFYNSHGLPMFDDVMLPAKKQNHMSAEDMFTLSAYIMQEYPEITGITSVKKAKLSSFGKEVKNTNALLYNLPKVKGLKTGTTNKSGACLVSCMPVEKDGVTHNLIVVLLGAEGNMERNRISEIGARYALSVFNSSSSGTATEKLKVMPKDPNKVVQRLVNNAKL
ncbi:MAG: D-alanyl-D-alanine carboxypeptidase [Pseudobutyrivibrio sp.]|nr:D-alanyl-D-alanine carboxypeptidase [Pseudobutyrivibrio sp.]